MWPMCRNSRCGQLTAGASDRRWATVTARVQKTVFGKTGADRGHHPGTNIMFDIDCKRVHVHKIEVRALPE